MPPGALDSRFAFPIQVSVLRHHLHLDNQFGSEQALLLILRRVGPIDDIAHELGIKRKRQIVAVNKPRLILVDDEQIIPLFAHRHIGIFAYLDVAVCAQDEKPALSSSARSVRRKPIQHDIPKPVVPTQHHVAKVLARLSKSSSALLLSDPFTSGPILNSKY
jgi:hypothetical protein